MAAPTIASAAGAAAIAGILAYAVSGGEFRLPTHATVAHGTFAVSSPDDVDDTRLAVARFSEPTTAAATATPSAPDELTQTVLEEGRAVVVRLQPLVPNADRAEQQVTIQGATLQSMTPTDVAQLRSQRRDVLAPPSIGAPDKGQNMRARPTLHGLVTAESAPGQRSPVWVALYDNRNRPKNGVACVVLTLHDATTDLRLGSIEVCPKAVKR